MYADSIRGENTKLSVVALQFFYKSKITLNKRVILKINEIEIK